MGRFVATTILFATLALSAVAAHAQDSAHATAAARALFSEGVECADREDWGCAVDRFEQAYALRPSPVIGKNLGVALMRVGRLVEASERLHAVLRDPTAAPAVRDEAQARLAEITPQLARLTLRVTGSRTDVELTLDGHPIPLSMADVAAPCDPGDHVIEARRGGVVVASAAGHVDAAGSVELTLEVPEPPPLPLPATAEPEPIASAVLAPPAPAPARAPEIYEEWWFWTIVGGVVAAGVGVGVGVGLGTSGSPTAPMGSLGVIDGRM